MTGRFSPVYSTTHTFVQGNDQNKDDNSLNSQEAEAESKEKHGVWDPMPELTTSSPYVDSNTYTCNPMPDSTLTLGQSRR